jgi:hypothetical protein
MVRNSPDNDEGIIGVLEDRQGRSSTKGWRNNLWSDIKKIGEEGISLPKPTTTLNPYARMALRRTTFWEVCLSILIQSIVREAFGEKDPIEVFPV